MYFSPRRGCTAAVVTGLAGAKRIVLVQAYLLTSAPIIDALIAAKARGVRVEIVLDGGNLADKFAAPVLARLADTGLPLWTDSAHAIAHNKVMVLDGATVITGSFNFTRAAESSNAENLLILRGKPLAALYANDFRLHQGHSTPYPPPPGAASASRPARGPGRER